MSDKALYSILAVLGAMPFVAAALLSAIGFEQLGPFGATAHVAASYGLAIVCFLAGAHWATYLYRQSSLPLNLFVASNIIVLGAWFPFVLAPIDLTIATLIIAFLALLYIDYRLLGVDVIGAGYFRVRSLATAIASVSLLALLFSR